MSPNAVLSTIVALTALACVACAADVSNDGDDQAQDVSFALMVQPLVDETCNCHQTSPILMAPFSLKAGEAYANLVAAPSMQVTSMPRVKPGVLNQSYVWHKLNNTQLEVGGSGAVMPSNFPLDAAQLAVFERWIASGAAP